MAGRSIDRPKAKADILSCLRAGNTRRASCAYAGVDEDQILRWAAVDAEFAEAIKKAEADAEVRHVANIAKAAGKGTWQASAWWLERKQYQDWRRREQLDLKQCSDEELIERAKAAFGGDAAPWLEIPGADSKPEPVSE